MSALPDEPREQRPTIAIVPGPPDRPGGLRAALVRVAPFTAFGFVPIGIAVVFLGGAVAFDALGLDFRQAYWPAGHAVLQGHTPYPPVDAHVLARGASFVYPPVVAIALAPFALLPVGVATVLAVILTTAALAGTLWTLGVRDWRCYGAAVASPAVLGCIQTAALSAPFVLAIALAWRGRSRGPAAPILIAAVVAAKLFLWPLLLWLAVARGLRTSVAAALGAVGLALTPWLLGFPGFRQYPHLLTLLTQVEGGHAYTPRALALSLGAGTQLAEIVAIAAGGSVLAFAVATARRPDAELRTLALTILAALLLSPVVWSHYFVLLLPIAAIARPTIGWAWIALPALWLSGGSWDAPSGLQVAIGLAVMVLATLPGLAARVTTVSAASSSPSHRSPKTPSARTRAEPSPPSGCGTAP